MKVIKFYDIDKDYIKYLKSFENKIPDISYDKHDKFICGVVLDINNVNYFAPISSFNKKQKTNLLIYNERSEVKGSIRSSFMFPAFDNVIKEKDFSTENYGYKRLLMSELNYCNNIIDDIISKANKIYKIGISKNHPLKQNCCNFKLLENKMLVYMTKYETEKRVAVTREEED